MGANPEALAAILIKSGDLALDIGYRKECALFELEKIAYNRAGPDPLAMVHKHRNHILIIQTFSNVIGFENAIFEIADAVAE